MMWTLRQEFAVAAEAIASFHLRGSAGWFDVTSGPVCHGILPRELTPRSNQLIASVAARYEVTVLHGLPNVAAQRIAEETGVESAR